MLKLEGLGIEIKSGLFFAVAGFVFSFITGFVAGISFSVVILRSLVTALIFSFLGYAAVIVLRKYVPEMYEMLSVQEASNQDEVVAQKGESEDSFVRGGETFEPVEESGDSSGFTGLDDQSYERLTSVQNQDLNNELNVAEGKMGNHIIMQDQFSGYEPKLIADAVRTMMSKDKE